MSAYGCHGSAATICHGSAATTLDDNSVIERTVKQQTATQVTQRKTDCVLSETVTIMQLVNVILQQWQ